MTRYVSYAVVGTVFEEEEQVMEERGRDAETGRTRWEKSSRKTGRWFVRFSGSSAMCVGNERPDFDVGDRVKVSIEKTS